MLIEQNNNQNNSDLSTFKVYIRVRPLNSLEKLQSVEQKCLSYSQKSIALKGKHDDIQFAFDKIYSEQSTQQDIFQGVADSILDNAFLGINGTIFCYGQTSSGKTHTIVGGDSGAMTQRSSSSALSVSTHAGLAPRILKQVFDRKDAKISNANKSNYCDIRIKIMMVEIYNEKVCDLLDLSKKDLKLRQNKKQGVFIEKVTEKYIASAQEGLDYLRLGLENRTVGRTNLNIYSSRSHMVFTISIHETNFQTKQAKSAKITLTDLAGSQKIAKTGVQGKMLTQAKKINTSLSTLGKVIHALSDSKSQHIPYRDSKLTRLLQESIGGNSLTRLIINVSPSILNQPQTITSLRFGARAKLIKNKPKINKEYTIEQLLTLLEKAELKIKQQKKIIQELQKNNPNQNSRSSLMMRRPGGYVVPSQKAITMHMICDDDDYDDQDDLLSETQSLRGRSEARSVASQKGRRNSSSVSRNYHLNVKQLPVFSSTANFQYEKTKPTRRPNLCKSMKPIHTIGGAKAFGHSHKSINTITITEPSQPVSPMSSSQKPQQSCNQKSLKYVATNQASSQQQIKKIKIIGNKSDSDSDNENDKENDREEVKSANTENQNDNHNKQNESIFVVNHNSIYKKPVTKIQTQNSLKEKTHNHIIYQQIQQTDIQHQLKNSLQPNLEQLSIVDDIDKISIGIEDRTQTLILKKQNENQQENQEQLLNSIEKDKLLLVINSENENDKNSKQCITQYSQYVLKTIMKNVQTNTDTLQNNYSQSNKENINQQRQKEILSTGAFDLDKIKQELRNQFKSQIEILQGKVDALSAMLSKTRTDLSHTESKYQQSLRQLRKQRQNIKAKDLHIAELKEKYKAKKHKINKQINELKTYWQNHNI